MKYEIAERLKQLPPYLFAELDRLKSIQKEKGVDVIDLGVGDPDHATPLFIVQALQKAAENADHHKYPSYAGMLIYRQAVAAWMKKRFSVTLDPVTEVVSLIGSKEGIANFPLAYVNPGEVVLIPSPSYPPTYSGTIFAGGEPYLMPLLEENRFLPDLKKIPEPVAKKAKILHVNYPNNPTSVTATKEFYREVVDFAKAYDLIVCSDMAYSELFDRTPPLSFLEVEGARDVGIEFHSLSKTYNMTGWRIGFACGNAELVAGLGKVKTNVDSGIFEPVQYAGITALNEGWDFVETMREIYRGRRRVFVEGLRKVGWKVAAAEAAFYVWTRVPDGMTSTECTKKILESTGIVVTPGNGFGKAGEGYVRFALTKDEARLEEAIERLRRI